MQCQTIKKPAIAALALTLGACASQMTSPPDLSMVNDQDFVATRAFQVRTSLSINATTLATFHEGDRFTGRAAPTSKEPWIYLILLNGPDGYVFGRPFMEARKPR